MKHSPLPIDGLILFEPDVYSDERGYFSEMFNERLMRQAGIDAVFVQDNESVSRKSVIRGLHFQKKPHEQGKLVRVVRGKAMDVVVDIRPGSPTFGRHISVELTGDNKKILWIPPGFAHGFEALDDDTVFLYKVTGYYDASSEGGIIYNDASLNISWQSKKPLVSRKDLVLPSFREYSLTLNG